jgi:hypothetical protein
VGLIRIPGGWFELEGEEPLGFVVTSHDEGGDPDAVRQLLRLVDDADAERRDES